MRILMIPLAALAFGAAVPAAAKPNDRERVDREELRGDRNDIRGERQDLRKAQRNGDRRDVREQKRDLKQAQREYRQDAKDWKRGNRYNYNRPDPRYDGYYADNYYRDGRFYQQRRLSANDRIYRGQDNRYYCRRSDGTTGLIIGGIGGGVLGNVIAPGGSKVLATLLGGGLGALLGNSIDRNNVVCR
jgi:Ni/Co efflux regulator RcnB